MVSRSYNPCGTFIKKTGLLKIIEKIKRKQVFKQILDFMKMEKAKKNFLKGEPFGLTTSKDLNKVDRSVSNFSGGEMKRC